MHTDNYKGKQPTTFEEQLFKEDMQSIANSNVFGLIYIMGKINNDKNEWVLFINNLSDIIDSYNNVELYRIGFPENWNEILSEM